MIMLQLVVIIGIATIFLLVFVLDFRCRSRLLIKGELTSQWLDRKIGASPTIPIRFFLAVFVSLLVVAIWCRIALNDSFLMLHVVPSLGLTLLFAGQIASGKIYLDRLRSLQFDGWLVRGERNRIVARSIALTICAALTFYALRLF